MKRLPACFLALLALVCAPAHAFLPPKDSAGPLTIEIRGIPGIQRLGVPLAFRVRATNTGLTPVAGIVRISVAEGWSVRGAESAGFSLEAGASKDLPFAVVPGVKSYAALYPIHAWGKLTSSPAQTAHAVAILKVPPTALPPRPASPAPVLTPPAGSRIPLETSGIAISGITPLNPAKPLRTFVTGDSLTGAFAGFRRLSRGGVRDALAIHPPWQKEAGGWTAWDYHLRLPKGQRAALTFGTAIRDNRSDEPASDGVEFRVLVLDGHGAHRVFNRFSASKRWQDARVDLSAWAGQDVTLRLAAGPGPARNTTCDEAYWGNPTLETGRPVAGETPGAALARQTKALARARAARAAAKAWNRTAPMVWRLKGSAGVYGAAVVPGPKGFADAAIAFAGPKGDVVFQGLRVEVDGQGVGTERSLLCLRPRAARWSGGRATLGGEIQRIAGMPGTKSALAQVRIWAQGGTLRMAFRMPGVHRDLRGQPRFTAIAFGPASHKALRVYAGFGNVLQNPPAFELPQGAPCLTAKHVGVDFEGGLSIAQASGTFPDSFTCDPSSRTYSLRVHNDATITVAPASSGAFAAARVYREDAAGFRPAPGVAALKGRMCLDNWEGGYAQDAAAIREAAAYGLTDCIYVKHSWQHYGYDYRLPDIYPPSGSLQDFLTLSQACRETGIKFLPHDNYIDFYPDAEGFSYRHILFNGDGTPQLAWYNEGREAQSYRWNPNSFRPFQERNIALLKQQAKPGGIFVDVFSAIPPLDFYDITGRYFTKDVSARRWGECFDHYRSSLGSGAVTVSEAGLDSLVGHLDGGESDHVRAEGPTGWGAADGTSERVPWHDMASHGSFVLLAGGLGDRYASGLDTRQHGYATDDYLSLTILGGRNPMCGGPFNRGAVMTYWLLHDVCKQLAECPMLAHAFPGGDIHRQQTRFGKDGFVTVNRGSSDWTVDGKTLPQYGFSARCGACRADISRRDGVITACAEGPGVLFVDARPPVEAGAGRGVVRFGPAELVREDQQTRLRAPFTVYGGLPEPYVAFLHFDVPQAAEEKIAFQCGPVISGDWRAAGEHEMQTVMSLPAGLPDGDYPIRAGFFNPETGERLQLRGLLDKHTRAWLGVLRVKDGQMNVLPDIATADPRVNQKRKMISFGRVSTNGAFRLMGTGDVQEIIPLPGSSAFEVCMKVPAGKTNAEVTLCSIAGKVITPLLVVTKEEEIRFPVPDGAERLRIRWR